MVLDRIRYRLALGIGHHLDLATMLDHAMPIFLSELQCEGSVVCTPRVTPKGHWHMFVAHSFPKSQNPLISAHGAAALPRGTDRSSLQAFWQSAPALHRNAPFNAIILPLPEFGALILAAGPSGKAVAPLTELEPVAQRLATACRHCRQHQSIRRTPEKNTEAVSQGQRDKTYLDQLFDNAQVGIIMAENDGTIIRINPEFQRIFGYAFEECIGRNIDALVAAEEDRAEAARITQSVSEGNNHRYEAQRRCKDGTIKQVAVMASPIVLQGTQVAVYAFYQDVTAQRQLESELIKAKKLEATGKLAGGIAHDFNNLLSIILGNIDLALLDLPVGNPSTAPLNSAKRNCLHAYDLTQKFITFSAGGKPCKKIVHLSDLLQRVTTEVFSQPPVAFRLDLPEALWPVEVDADQFRHVLSGVLINAAEALTEEGQVIISGSNLGQKQCSKNMLLTHAGPHIRLTIEDNGVGVPAEALPHLFDPYYSTKKTARRTGLGMGLTVAHSIINQHDGKIQIESRENQGTTVCLYLPAVPKEI